MRYVVRGKLVSALDPICSWGRWAGRPEVPPPSLQPFTSILPFFFAKCTAPGVACRTVACQGREQVASSYASESRPPRAIQQRSSAASLPRATTFCIVGVIINECILAVGFPPDQARTQQQQQQQQQQHQYSYVAGSTSSSNSSTINSIRSSSSSSSSSSSTRTSSSSVRCSSSIIS